MRSPLEQAFDRLAARLFGPLDATPARPPADANNSPIPDRRRGVEASYVLDLIEQPLGGPLVYSDRERTNDGEPAVELILYRPSLVPVMLRVDLG
jgi:hypothetical protein